MDLSGYISGYGITAEGRMHGLVWSPTTGTAVDINTRLKNAPVGMEIYYILSMSENGYMAAYTNAGLVLLKPAEAGPPPSPATLGAITANDPVAVGTALNVAANFTDINIPDAHTAEWTWDTLAKTTGLVSETSSTGSGSVTGTYVFNAAGVYNVTLTVTDSTKLPASVTRQVVVYDASAGFVTGGGWLMSPPGAFKANPALAGRANFGFVSKYLKGAVKPTGETEFQFQAANLNFHSSDYDWLVVSGARAQYKGTGNLNGKEGYKFLLTAVDGQINGGGGKDRFRMKIWHYDADAKADVVDYDNQLDTSTEGSVNEGTEIAQGNISIKTK